MNEPNQISEQRTRWLACFGVIILPLIPYGIVNHLPIGRYVIPFLLGEQLIPFLPWTFLVYVSIFVQALIILHLIPHKYLKRVFYSLLYMVLISTLFFLLFPTEFPRELYPSTNHFISLIRLLDNAGNCFPSSHVAVTLFMASCYHLVEKSLLKKTLMWIWTLAIIISVLTTKQHYLIDIVGGIALALPFIYEFKRRSKL